jgi:ribosome maturation protein Sdo1
MGFSPFKSINKVHNQSQITALQGGQTLERVKRKIINHIKRVT